MVAIRDIYALMLFEPARLAKSNVATTLARTLLRDRIDGVKLGTEIIGPCVMAGYK